MKTQNREYPLGGRKTSLLRGFRLSEWGGGLRFQNSARSATSVPDHCCRLVFPDNVFGQRFRLVVSDSVRGRCCRAVFAVSAFGQSLRPVASNSFQPMLSASGVGQRFRSALSPSF